MSLLLQLQATPGITVLEVVEAVLPEVGQVAYQVYQFPLIHTLKKNYNNMINSITMFV